MKGIPKWNASIPKQHKLDSLLLRKIHLYFYKLKMITSCFVSLCIPMSETDFIIVENLLKIGPLT